MKALIIIFALALSLSSQASIWTCSGEASGVNINLVVERNGQNGLAVSVGFQLKGAMTADATIYGPISRIVDYGSIGTTKALSIDFSHGAHYGGASLFHRQGIDVAMISWVRDDGTEGVGSSQPVILNCQVGPAIP